MKSTDQNIMVGTVDSQPIVIPDEKGWEMLLEAPEIDTIPVSAMIYVYRRFCDEFPKFPGLRMGFVLAPTGKTWISMAVFWTGDRWQRVIVETVQCRRCLWRGTVAQTIRSGLYFGAANVEDAMKRARELPGLGCPQCGLTLLGHVIWINPEDLPASDAKV